MKGEKKKVVIGEGRTDEEDGKLKNKEKKIISFRC